MYLMPHALKFYFIKMIIFKFYAKLLFLIYREEFDCKKSWLVPLL